MQLSTEELNNLQDVLASRTPVSQTTQPVLKPHVFCGRVCIVRAESAGVFIGKVQSVIGSDVLLENARRLWKWSGAASLSQLAVEGTADPENCKFPIEVPEIFLMGAIEIIPASVKAISSIAGVKIWEV
jgi:hypothetical protein